jgi:uncharacterized protein YdhG (YjbR/CyaY superfamily)
MKINASTPEEYINQLPDDRREVVTKIRAVIQQHLPEGFEETISYGMIAYVVPLSKYPAGYHCNPKERLPFLSIASQKNYIALYHSGIYAVPKMYDWFKESYLLHAKGKPDMAKSCIRFKKLDDIPYNLIASLVEKITVKEWVKVYEENLKR